MTTRFRKTKIHALALACATILSASAMTAHAESAFTAEQKKELEALFKQYISDNPALILESVKQYQIDEERKTMQNAQENLKDYQTTFKSNDIPMAGNPDGDVTVVEFFDFNCGYCKKAFGDIQKILEEDKNLRVVFVDMPILGPSSVTMSTLALAAHKQGKYFEMHTALMDYRGSQSDTAFMKLAEEIGLDTGRLKEDMQSAEVQAEISKARSMGQALGIRGTPGFVIDDEVYPGYIGIKALRDNIKKAREQKSGTGNE